MMWSEGFYKLLLIGDSNVGKSSIQQQYVNDRFLSTYNPTVGANIKYKTVNISGEEIKLQIRDLSGQENIHDVSSVYYKGIDGIMLIFDITKQESFTHIHNWFQQTWKYVGSDDVQLLLVGNKQDLNSERAVSLGEAEKLTMELGDIPYIEISAKTGQHVNGAFELMIKRVLKDPVEENKKLIVQSLKQAKEKQRTISVTFIKVFLTGSAAAGKTSFSHLLMQKEMKENHDSTGLIQASHVVSICQKFTFNDTSATESNDITWIALDRSREIQYLRSFLVSPDSSSPPSANSKQMDGTSTDNKDHNSTFLQKGINIFWYLIFLFTVVIPSFLYPMQNTTHHIEPSTLNDDQSKISDTKTTTLDISPASVITEKLSSLKDILQDGLISNSNAFVYVPGKKLNIITILDTGGQPQYIHFLPTINIHPTINFVVHDLSKDLKDQVQVEYNKNGKPVVFPYPLEYSYLDMIKLLMSAANDSADKDTSYARQLNLNTTTEDADNNSCLCLVGTHKDQVDDEVIKSTATTLTTLVNKMKCRASVWQNEDETVLFAVDNTTAGSENEDHIASIIRSRIENVAAAREVYELPVTWMLLEVEIRKFCEQNKKAYISFEQCLTLAKDSGLMSSDEEVKNALNYHHFLGVLLYFKDIEGLCDYVITDHQWWFDKLSNIICLTLQQSHDHNAINELKFQGILSKTLLHQMEWKDDNIIKKKHFLSLLFDMKIIACLEEKNGTYFIPFVLPTYNPQESEILHQYGNLQGEPLLVQFCSGLLPRGFFCSLVVHLLREGWKLHFSNDLKKHHSFNNLVTFCLPNASSLSLFDKVNYLELQIRHKGEMPQNLDIHHTLVPVLEDVCKHLRFDIKRLRYGFLCSCKKGIEEHIAFLPNDISSAKCATCSIDSTYPVKMSSLHMQWFSKLPFSDKTVDFTRRPDLKDLQNIITPDYAAHWITIGTQLGIPSGILQGIQANFPADVFRCCNMMLEKWLDTDCNATWDKMHKAIECPAVTKAIQNFHQANYVSSDVEVDQSVITVPTMKLLNQIVIPRIAEDWELIAGYLEYKVEFIQLIKKDESTGDKDCCVALFEDWLTTDNGTSPKTWSTLIRGLREIKQFKSNTEKIIQDLAKAGVPV